MEVTRSVKYQIAAERMLLPLLFVTIAAVTYFMATVSSPLIPLDFPFGFVKVLPIQYWVMLFVTALLLVASVAARKLSYLWLSTVLMTLIVPGLSDILYSYPRDIFATVASEYISRNGVFNPADHIFLNFPGSEILFSSLVIVTKLDSTIIIRAYGLFYNLILLGICYVAFRRFGVTQTAAVLGSLTFVLSFYLQGVLIYSSLNGFIFYVVIATLILMPYSNRTVNMILLALFFAGMVVTHAFSPILTVAGAAGVLVGWEIARIISRRIRRLDFGVDLPSVDRFVLIIFLLVVAAYWAYFAFTVFSYGLFQISSFQFSSLFEGVSNPLLAPQTSYEISYVSVTRLYAPVLFLAFLVYFLAVRDRRKLPMLFLIVGLVGAIFLAVAGYVREFIPRIFSFATFPLCYGVAKLFESNRKMLRVVAVITLIVVLGLHLPAHYGQDSFQVYPNSTIQGVQFLAQHSYSNATYDSIAREFSWHYYFDIYRSNLSDEGPGYYYVSSYSSSSLLIYTQGDTAFDNSTLQLNSNNLVYSNGLFGIYLRT